MQIAPTHFLSLLVATALPAAATSTGSQPIAYISLSTFGAVPDDGLDDTDALTQALLAMQSGDRLICPPGQYDLFLTATPKEFTISQKTSISIVGPDATFLMHGFDVNAPHTWPHGALFRFVDCSDVVVEGITVDMSRTPFSNGTVTATSTTGAVQTVTVSFPPEFPISPSMVVQAILRHTPGGKPSGKGCDLYYPLDDTGVPTEQPLIVQPGAPQILDITLKKYATVAQGDQITVRHRVYGYNAFTAERCQRFRLDDVTVYATPGMGLWSAGSDDVTVHDMEVLRKPGTSRLMSTTADATHFNVNNGFVHLTGDNIFEGMGDDGFNVHGAYSGIVGQPRANVVSLASASGYSQWILYEAGDTIEFFSGTLASLATATVVAAVPTSHGLDVLLDVPVPALPNVAYATNQTRVPSVQVLGATMRDHRGRGLVIQSRDVLVDGCTITGCTGPGIDVTCDVASFHESIGTRSVSIRNCTLQDVNNGQFGSNHAQMAAIYAFCDLAGGYGQAGTHDGLYITGNSISNTAYSAVFVASTMNTSILNNTFDGICQASSFPAYSQGNVVWFTNADRATVAGNTLVNPASLPWGMTSSTGINVYGNTGF